MSVNVGPGAASLRGATPPGEVEEEIRADRARLRLLVEHLPVVAYTMDRVGGSESIRYVTGGIERLTGYTAEEWVSDPGLWMRVVHPNDRDAAMTAWTQTIDAGLPYEHEYRVVRPDGSLLWVREKAVPTVLADTIQVDGIFEDVTERRLAQQRALIAEERMRELVNQVSAVFYEEMPGGPDEPTIYVSPQVEEILGVSVDEYVADPAWWIDHVHPGDRERIVAEFDAQLAGVPGAPEFTEYRLVRPDGSVVWLNDRTTVTRDAAGLPEFVRGVMFDVTAQKLAESRMAETEERYRNLVEHMPAVTYTWEVGAVAGSAVYYTSPQIHVLLGYTVEEWEKDPDAWMTFIHPDDRDRVLSATALAESTGARFLAEYRFVHKDGHTVWVHDEATLLRRDPTGKPWLLQGVMFDITHRVEADRALQESLRRFQALAEGAPVGIFLTDPGGSCTYVNERWCEAAGRPAASALGRGWAEAFHPDDRDRVSAEWRTAAETGAEFVSEYRFQRPNGEVRWVNGHAVALLDAEGEPAGHVGTIEDITERRAAEEQLRLIRSAVEHTAQGVIVMEHAAGGDDTTIVYVNPASEAVTGYREDELVGRSPRMLLERRGGESQPALLPLPEAGVTGEVELRRKDGTTILIEWSASPIQQRRGRSSHVVAVVRDVTGVRQAERGLQESIEALRTADAEQRRLVIQLVETQEHELDRMAGGIEDRSLQQMAAVRMRMETLRRSVSDPDQLGALDKVESSVSLAVGHLRGLLSELRPRELATEGLAGAIRSYLAGLDGSLRVSLEGELGAEPAPSQQATAFRIVQEAVAFAAGSRGATRLRVVLAAGEDGFTVRILDDGAAWRADAPSTMRDRARLAGGRCTIGEAEGEAVVQLWLPPFAPSGP
jgi:PAS domain S-box-containing protein